MAAQNGDWRSVAFRQKVIANINDTLKKSGTHNKSAVEIEKHIFQKANSREGYMSMLARIILACTSNQKPVNQVVQQPVNQAPILETNIVPTPMISQEALKKENTMNKILTQPSPMSNMSAPSPQIYQTVSPVTMVTQGKPVKQAQARTPQMTPGSTVNYPSPSPIIPSPNISTTGLSPAPASSPQLIQSPSSLHATRLSGIPSVESPGSFNPPSNPGSQESPVKLSDKEEQLYVEKLKQLSVYTNHLQKMIAKLQNDEDKDRKTLTKLKRVLGILGNPKERVPYQALLKVENVLVRMFKVEKPSTAPVGQSLLKVLSDKADSPQSNNTLYRMMAPTFSTIYGPPICPPVPPKRRREEPQSNHDDELPQVVKCEIAELASKFTTMHEECDRMTLTCSLNDKTLPAVPSLTICIPADYPHASPCFSTNDYDSTQFLRDVKQRLQQKLADFARSYSLTTLLFNWESCLRYVNNKTNGNGAVETSKSEISESKG